MSTDLLGKCEFQKCSALLMALLIFTLKNSLPVAGMLWHRVLGTTNDQEHPAASNAGNEYKCEAELRA